MAKMTRVTICYNHFMIIQAWGWNPDDPSDSNLLGERVSKWCCPTWNITTSHGATRFSNSVKFKWQSNCSFQRCYFKFLKFAWFVKLPHALFTHIGQRRLEDYWGKWPFCYRQIACFLRAWQVLAWSSKGTQGWLVWIKIFEKTTRMMLKKSLKNYPGVGFDSLRQNAEEFKWCLSCSCNHDMNNSLDCYIILINWIHSRSTDELCKNVSFHHPNDSSSTTCPRRVPISTSPNGDLTPAQRAATQRCQFGGPKSGSCEGRALNPTFLKHPKIVKEKEKTGKKKHPMIFVCGLDNRILDPMIFFCGLGVLNTNPTKKKMMWRNNPWTSKRLLRFGIWDPKNIPQDTILLRRNDWMSREWTVFTPKKWWFSDDLLEASPQE